MTATAPRISVILGTHAGRRRYLWLCLDSLERTRGVEHEEIVIVAKDPAFVDEVKAEYGERLPLACFVSELKGVSDKRNLGLREARGEIVTILDDDVVVPEDYFESVAAVFNDGATCVAGAIEPIFEAEIPAEMRDSVFRIGGFNRHRGEELPKRWIGANCAFLRQAILAAGSFDTRLGPGGTYLPWGDDEDMFRRLDARHGIRFAPEITVMHHIQPERLTARYVLGRGFKTGRTLCVLDRLHQPDFWTRARVVPLMWLLSLVRLVTSGFSFDARLRVRNLSGYVTQMARIALRGFPQQDPRQ